MIFNSILSRLKWSLWSRIQTQRTVRGFNASPFSFCGDTCHFGEFSWIGRNANLVDVSIGRFSYLNGGSVARLSKIGNFCSIGQNVKIGGLGKHPFNVSTHPSFFQSDPQVGLSFHTIPDFQDFEPVTIGHDVWIGDRAIILGGVNIGTGAVIGAGTVVTRDVGAYSVVAGAPARQISHRIPMKIIDEMLSSSWWDWDIDRLREMSQFIGSSDIDTFLRKVKVVQSSD